MTSNCDETDLESIVKVEAEQFEDEIIKERKNKGPKIFVYDALKPVIALHRVDDKTIARWTEVKTKNGVEMKKIIQNFKTKISSDFFSCDLCPHWFTIKSSLKNHMRCHQLKLSNAAEISIGKKCPFCFKTVDVKKFRNHKQNHERLFNKGKLLLPGQIRCRKCKLVLNSTVKFKNHMSIVHFDGKGHDCFCGKIYRTLILLKSHQRHVHYKPKTSCEMCGKEFRGYLSKFAHWESHHRKIHGSYGQWKLQNVRILVSLKNAGPYTCDICSKVYSTRELTHNHFRNCHIMMNLSCDLCGKTFNSKAKFLTHLKTQHMTKMFDCDFCGKKFAWKNELQSHIRMHNKKTKCQVCCSLVSNMKTHIKTVHVQGQKVPCSICGVRVAKNYLKRHIIARHVEKPKLFKCEECDEAFSAQSLVIKHRKKEHGLKAFPCRCGFYSYCAKTTREHILAHDGNSSCS